MPLLLFEQSITVQEFIDFIDFVNQYYQSLGLLAALGVPFLETLVPIIPLFSVLAFNTLSYGLLYGFIFTYIGTTAGTIVLFMTNRFLVKKLLKKRWSKQQEVVQFFTWIELTHPLLHILILMVPFSPTFMINYSMGLTNMTWKRFILITVTSRFFLLMICIPLSLSLINLYNANALGGVEILWLTLAGILVLLSVIVGQVIKKKTVIKNHSNTR